VIPQTLPSEANDVYGSKPRAIGLAVTTA
jgi:hypothetical protein